jgi:hypothetical protein
MSNNQRKNTITKEIFNTITPATVFNRKIIQNLKMKIGLNDTLRKTLNKRIESLTMMFPKKPKIQHSKEVKKIIENAKRKLSKNKFELGYQNYLLKKFVEPENLINYYTDLPPPRYIYTRIPRNKNNLLSGQIQNRKRYVIRSIYKNKKATN